MTTLILIAADSIDAETTAMQLMSTGQRVRFASIDNLKEADFDDINLCCLTCDEAAIQTETQMLINQKMDEGMAYIHSSAILSHISQ